MSTNLVSGHAILFHLFKFALELILALPFLLCSAHVHLPAIQFFSIHVIHSLQWNKHKSTETSWTRVMLITDLKSTTEVEVEFSKSLDWWQGNVSTDKNMELVPTFCASSCLSKLTKPNPLDLPFSSVITRILSAGPTKIKTHLRGHNHTGNLLSCKQAASTILFSYHICQTTPSASHHPCPPQSSWCKHL